MKKLFVLSLLFSVPIFCMNQAQRRVAVDMQRLMQERNRLHREALRLQVSELQLKKLRTAIALMSVNAIALCPKCGMIGAVSTSVGSTKLVCNTNGCALYDQEYGIKQLNDYNVQIAARTIIKYRHLLLEDDASDQAGSAQGGAASGGVAAAAADAISDDDACVSGGGSAAAGSSPE